MSIEVWNRQEEDEEDDQIVVSEDESPNYPIHAAQQDFVLAAVESELAKSEQQPTNITPAKTKKKQNKPKPTKPTNYIEVLEWLSKRLKPEDFPQGYHSPCGMRCPNGLIGRHYLKWTGVHFDHPEVDKRLRAIGIKVPKESGFMNDEYVCPWPKCDNKQSEYSMLAYHLASTHDCTLPEVVEFMKKVQIPERLR